MKRVGAINEEKKGRKEERKKRRIAEKSGTGSYFYVRDIRENDEARFGSQFFVAHDSIIEIDFFVGMAVFQSRLLPFRAKIVPSLAKE